MARCWGKIKRNKEKKWISLLPQLFCLCKQSSSSLQHVSMESKWIFQSALVICVRDQCQHTLAFQTGFYRLNKVPLSCCFVFFFPIVTFHLIVTVRKRKPPTNQIVHVIKSWKCRYLQNGDNTCCWQWNKLFKGREDVVQASNGFGPVDGGKDSSSHSHFTFLCSQGLLADLAGVWEVQGNRLGPKAGQIVYYLQLQEGSSGSHQNSQHQGQTTCLKHCRWFCESLEREELYFQWNPSLPLLFLLQHLAKTVLQKQASWETAIINCYRCRV